MSDTCIWLQYLLFSWITTVIVDRFYPSTIASWLWMTHICITAFRSLVLITTRHVVRLRWQASSLVLILGTLRVNRVILSLNLWSMVTEPNVLTLLYLAILTVSITVDSSWVFLLCAWSLTLFLKWAIHTLITFYIFFVTLIIAMASSSWCFQNRLNIFSHLNSIFLIDIMILLLLRLALV